MNRIVQSQGVAPPWVELQQGSPSPLAFVNILERLANSLKSQSWRVRCQPSETSFEAHGSVAQRG